MRTGRPPKKREQQVFNPTLRKLAESMVVETMQQREKVQNEVTRIEERVGREIGEPIKDPFAAVIIDGLNPDSVLGKVFSQDGPSVVAVRVSDSPIEYLHSSRVGRPISDECYRAAKLYQALEEDNRQFGAVGNTLDRQESIAAGVKWTPEDRELKDFGRMMAVSDDSHGGVARDPIEGSRIRLHRVNDRLSRIDKSILTDLLLRDIPVGRIALRWGANPDAMGLLVRVALCNLTLIMESVDAEFRAEQALLRGLE